MTKPELIHRLADKLPHLPANDVESAINTLIENLSSTLASGERIDVRGFGSFSNRYRPARLGRNPSTGDPVCGELVNCRLKAIIWTVLFP